LNIPLGSRVILASGRGWALQSFKYWDMETFGYSQNKKSQTSFFSEITPLIYEIDQYNWCASSPDGKNLPSSLPMSAQSNQGS
jgi:hypothetical protein